MKQQALMALFVLGLTACGTQSTIPSAADHKNNNGDYPPPPPAVVQPVTDPNFEASIIGLDEEYRPGSLRPLGGCYAGSYCGTIYNGNGSNNSLRITYSWAEYSDGSPNTDEIRRTLAILAPGARSTAGQDADGYYVGTGCYAHLNVYDGFTSHNYTDHRTGWMKISNNIRIIVELVC